jgi:DNA-binding transcriptional ArsR family regulator
MKNETVAPVCQIEIINETKVKKARKNIADTEQILSMADTFKLLGDPTRLKMVLSLMKNELCVCDLSAVTGSSVSAISHQLRLLRTGRLVKYRKEGKMVFYSIDDDHVSSVINQIKGHTEER